MSVWNNLTEEGTTVPDRLTEQIASFIDDHAVAPGDHLPSERALAQQLGASRVSVRQALQQLEIRGYITRIPRVGRVVSAPEHRTDSAMFGPTSAQQRAVREVMDLRLLIEPPIAERAAERRLDVDLPRLREPIDTAEQAIGADPTNVAEVRRCDLRFHTTIAVMTQNPLVEQLVSRANEWMAPSRTTPVQTQDRIRNALDAHRRIYEAILARDTELAHTAMRRHLLDVLRVIDPLTASPPGR